ncbi:MAG: CAAX prenyl protease-related protein [Planctomycetota bacterium]
MHCTENTDREVPKSSFWSAWKQLLERQPWLPFVLPFAVFMLSGFLEPSMKSESVSSRPASSVNLDSREANTPAPNGDEFPGLSYPLAYSLRIALTGFAIVLVWPTWRKIPWRYSHWAIAVGLLGGALWIGICRLNLVDHVLTRLSLESWSSFGDRPSFDPYMALGDSPTMMVNFLAIRLVGLACIVPLVEEFFLRGFLMRFIEKAEWWTIDPGTVSQKAAVTATVYGIVAHPAEPLAAAVWFSLITVLHARTGSLWNCVIAHAITNGMLGLYILTFRDWTLW